MQDRRGVFILGLDIHGKECIDIIARNGKYHLLGYISQQADAPGAYAGYPVLDIEEAILRYPEAGLLPLHVWKSHLHNDRWVTLIDPSAFIASTAKVGRGCIIYPNCFIGADAVLGEGVLMLSGCIVNHDCVIGDRVTLASHITLAGSVRVGESAYLGQGCNIRQVLSVGPRAFVGMGAVVTKNVPEGATVVGNPARPFTT